MGDTRAAARSAVRHREGDRPPRGVEGRAQLSRGVTPAPTRAGAREFCRAVDRYRGGKSITCFVDDRYWSTITEGAITRPSRQCQL